MSGRVWVLSQSMMLAAAAYGIQRRAVAVWWLGWVALVLGAVSIVRSAFSSPPALPLAVLPIPLLVVGYWAFWWYRQRSYFVRDQSEKT